MTAQTLVASIPSLPRPPQAIIRLISLLNQDDQHNDEVVDVVRQDMTLTAKLLRFCNSVAAGTREPITSVDEAVFRLGHSVIMRTAWALSLQGSLDRPLKAYSVEEGELWQHSLITAKAAEIIASDLITEVADSSTAFTAGLLHDMGKVVLNQAFKPELVAQVRQHMEAGQCSRSEAERAVFGVSHAEVGAELLAQWKLPDVLVEAVANHHQPVTQPQIQLSAIVHLADSVVHMVGGSIGWDGYAERTHENLFRDLGLDADNVQLLCARVFVSLEQLKAFVEKS